jgi:hypothetical protein
MKMPPKVRWYKAFPASRDWNPENPVAAKPAGYGMRAQPLMKLPAFGSHLEKSCANSPDN